MKTADPNDPKISRVLGGQENNYIRTMGYIYIKSISKIANQKCRPQKTTLIPKSI